ncbi:MAG: porin [Alphaproteobacteria bacterium]|nr:porin [Alphaproteobacteria bacterium]
MKKNSLYALAAAGLLAGFGATSAMAADLGGDCCADLEERVAELEATTARKGNRKVSLTLSGFVAQQVLAWDDGQESNVYVTDTGSISIGTHFAFSGQAQITTDVSAGFMIKIEAMNNDSLTISQNVDDSGNAFSGSGSALALESAYWFIKSNTLGRLSVGQQSGAADNQAILPDGSGSLVQANYVFYDVNGFLVRRSDGALSRVNFGSFATCQTFGDALGAAGDCEGDPNNNVRYDTPTFAGFSASASWGEDDVWGVSGRYAGEFGGQIKFAAAVAYTRRTDDNAAPIAKANGGLDAGAFSSGAYIEHIPTGLFVYGAYIAEDHEVTNSARGFGRANPEGENWYIKAGIKQKWSSLGSTTFYGEYGENDDKMSAALFDAGVSSSTIEQYGVGIVQNVDAAAMQLWVSWRHFDVDSVNCAGAGCAAVGLNNGTTSFDAIDIVKAGALIAF